MNRKISFVLLLLAAVLIGASGVSALPQYAAAGQALYGSGFNCGTCHVNPAGGGALTAYGSMFAAQPNHNSEPGTTAALTAIGNPSATPTATSTATPTPTSISPQIVAPVLTTNVTVPTPKLTLTLNTTMDGTSPPLVSNITNAVLFDTSGNNVANATLPDNMTAQFNLSGISPGDYFIEVNGLAGNHVPTRIDSNSSNINQSAGLRLRNSIIGNISNPTYRIKVYPSGTPPVVNSSHPVVNYTTGENETIYNYVIVLGNISRIEVRVLNTSEELSNFTASSAIHPTGDPFQTWILDFPGSPTNHGHAYNNTDSNCNGCHGNLSAKAPNFSDITPGNSLPGNGWCFKCHYGKTGPRNGFVDPRAAVAANGTIAGNVTNASSGLAISGATVAANGMMATTNANGSYSISIATGTYTVTANAAGYQTNTTTGVVVTPGNVTPRNFVLIPVAAVLPSQAAFNISGFKINNATGSGIQGWNITVTNATMQKSMLTDANGSYKFTDLVNGTYNVSEEMKPGFTPAGATLQGVTINGSDVTNVNFTNNLIPISAANRTFVADLTGGEEVPPEITLARANATFNLSDNGTVLQFKVTVANITNATASHIHLAPVGVNGSIVVNLFTGPTKTGRFDGVLAEGNITQANLTGPLSGQPFSALLDNMTNGNTYVNIHTTQHPAGEIRGQIRVAPVPNARFSISGFKINNATKNGIQDWNITLRNGTTNALIDSKLTDANGFYQFIVLVNGSYNVSEEMKAGFTPTNATTKAITVENMDVMNVNFTNNLTIAIPQVRTLTSINVATAPVIDGIPEAIWNQAIAMTVNVSGGANAGSHTVVLKSVYTNDSVYFLATWNDPTESLRRLPWQKQANGSWIQLKTPNAKEGGEETYYEDKFSQMWNKNITGFETSGCLATCHAGENSDVKAYGNMYTARGEIGDLWHMKMVRTNTTGFVDDQYIDSTNYSNATPDAGRHSDPGLAPYYDNINANKTTPNFTSADQPAPPYWIFDDQKQPFNDTYNASDEIAGIIVRPPTGDRADIKGKAVYKDGNWTLEYSRKLTTGSQFDVQFSDLTKEYLFGTAIFDNAQTRHSYDNGASKLVFAPSIVTPIIGNSSISGFKFNDINGNGTWESVEPGLANWTIVLTMPNGSNITNTTNKDGFYNFSNLSAGNYTIGEVLQPGWVRTFPSVPVRNITLLEGENVTNIDFGNMQAQVPEGTLNISGFKINDTNGNGVWDTGEMGIENWNIKLFNNSGTQAASTSTDASGFYQFTNLIPDRYNVTEEMRTGFTPTNATTKAIIVENMDVMNVNFTNQVTVTPPSPKKTFNISGFKINNATGSGVQGWSITLKNTTLQTSMLTGADGSYMFTNLANGTYNVTEEMRAGWTNVSPMSRQVTINGQDKTNVNFTNQPPSVVGTFDISGFKINDTSGNGVWDAGEKGIDKWNIRLLNVTTGTQIASTMTDSTGFYSFTGLTNGTYNVTEEIKAGWTNTGPMSRIVTINGQDMTNVNFTNQITVTPPTPTEIFNISGSKVNDTNGNGVWDTGEMGIANWNIQLLNVTTGTQVASTSTNASGFYRFTKVAPGTYNVTEETKAGFTPTSATFKIVTVENMDMSDVNFLNMVTVIPPPPSQATFNISGFKVNDTNGNNIWDTGEMGIDKWNIMLLNDKGTQIASTSTDTQGFYEFTGLDPGTYKVTEEIKAGFTPSSDTSKDVTIEDKDVKDVNFLNHVTVTPPPTKTNTISGFKINDLNGNGKQDAGENGLSGWNIKLTGIVPETADIHEETTTDDQGFYSFENLPAGMYLIEETVKGDYVPSGPPVLVVTLENGTNSMNNNFMNRPVSSLIPDLSGVLAKTKITKKQ